MFILHKAHYALDINIAKAQNNDRSSPHLSLYMIKHFRQSLEISKFKFGNHMRVAVDRTTCSIFRDSENDIKKPNEKLESPFSDFIHENGGGNTFY